MKLTNEQKEYCVTMKSNIGKVQKIVKNMKIEKIIISDRISENVMLDETTLKIAHCNVEDENIVTKSSLTKTLEKAIKNYSNGEVKEEL